MANWEWGVFPAMTVMILFFVPFYMRRRISTMPEWLEHRFGPSSRFTFAVITLLSYVFINLWDINSFNLAGILLGPVVAFHVAAAYFRPAPSAEAVDRWVWRPRLIFLPAEEKAKPRPWYKSLVLWWGFVAAIYVTLYVVFW